MNYFYRIDSISVPIVCSARNRADSAHPPAIETGLAMAR